MKGTKPQLRADSASVAQSLPAPSWLSAEAKKEWRRVMPDLALRRILTTPDLGSLEHYCVAVGRVRELEKSLRRAFEAPLFRAQNQAMTTARQLAAELGLTPVSRSRPAVREKDEEDGGDNPLDLS